MVQESKKPLEVYTQFENATSFINQIELKAHIKRAINFEAGNQWKMSEDVSDFPKITLNIIKQIGKVRQSNILQNEYGFLVSTNDQKSIRKIQDFLKYLHEVCGIKKKDLKVLADDFRKGTGILYFYWDAESRHLMSKSGGRLKAEVIDIRNFRVADPYIQDVQEQEWVIFVTRERINAIKAKYGVEVAPTQYKETSDTEKEPISEDVEHEFVNVYTKFYRNSDGQVCFTITTEFDVLKGETALNPFYQGNTEEVPNTLSTPDVEKVDSLEAKYASEVFGLYPFAIFVSNERDNCFYGLPSAYELIEAQKSINNHFSVYDKAIQDNVLGGFIMREGIMGDQEITTDNGQIVQLKMLPNERVTDVFGRIPVNNVPADALNYSGNLLGVVKSVSGATNVQIGQSDYAGQSGKQTQMLLERAKENSTDIAMLFNQYKKDQANIMFLFSKFFYDNEDFQVVEHGFKKDEIRAYNGEEKFDGSAYLNENIMLDIRVGAAPSFSEFSAMELLGLMVQSGQAPLDVYIANLPDGYVNNKQELLDMLQDNSQKAIQQLQQQLKQAQDIMQQMAKAYEKTKKDMDNIDSVIAENQRLKSQMADLAAKMIERSQQDSETTQKIMQEMQQVLVAAKTLNKDKKES